MAKETCTITDIAEQIERDGSVGRQRKLFTDITWDYALTQGPSEERRSQAVIRYTRAFSEKGSRLIVAKLFPERSEPEHMESGEVAGLAFQSLKACMGAETRSHWQTYNALLEGRGLETVGLDDAGQPEDHRLTFSIDGLEAQWEDVLESEGPMMSPARLIGDELRVAMWRQCHRELFWLPRIVNAEYVSGAGT